MSSGSAEQIARFCVSELGDPSEWSEPPGYHSLGLGLIDSVWSIGVKYAGVQNVIRTYCDRAGVQNLPLDAEATSEHTVRDVCGAIERAGGPRNFAEEVVDNRQRTSSSNGILKADAVLRCGHALLENQIERRSDLVEATSGQREAAKAAWLAIPGQRSGISWRYLCILAGMQSIKPDRMITRFVARALERDSVPPGQAEEALHAAWKVLIERAPGLSLRALDHAVWSHERSRGR